MTQPIIGITSGKIINHRDPWAPWTMGQSYTYIDAITVAGGLPIILPIIEPNDGKIDQLISMCDGFLFSGGNDIDPERYHHKNTGSVELDPKRDAFELTLIARALKADKPVLAICRGHQLLNVSRGGTLHQDILTQFPGALNHRESTMMKDANHLAHTVAIQPDSRLAGILGRTDLPSNSHHHQSIDKLGQGLEVVARSDDDIIEAIEDTRGKFIQGIQCHPESIFVAAEPTWAKLFTAFVDAARP